VVPSLAKQLLSIDGTPDALNHLQQVYGVGSQSTDNTPSADATVQLSPSKAQPHPQELPDVTTNCEVHFKGSSSVKKKKSVSFADEVDGSKSSSIVSKKVGEHVVEDVVKKSVQCSPTVRRPVTRSTSPVKTPVSKQCSPKARIVTDSPRRMTRFATAQARAMRMSAGTEVVQEVTTDVTETGGMNMNLELEFGSSKEKLETEEQQHQRELIEFNPSFELGFDDKSSEQSACVEELQGVDITTEEPVVISSNEGSGDSLDKIYAAIEMPLTTPGIGKKDLTVGTTSLSAGPSSCTPVPVARQKRVVNQAQNQKSPFVEYNKKEVASKFANEVYNKMCEYGGVNDDESKKIKIIDRGGFYIYLSDLANSVRPGAWLSNSTCEVALHVLACEMAKHKKHVMPLRVSVSSYLPFFSYIFFFSSCSYNIFNNI
jgi:hypothetical protein